MIRNNLERLAAILLIIIAARTGYIEYIGKPPLESAEPMGPGAVVNALFDPYIDESGLLSHKLSNPEFLELIAEALEPNSVIEFTIGTQNGQSYTIHGLLSIDTKSDNPILRLYPLPQGENLFTVIDDFSAVERNTLLEFTQAINKLISGANGELSIRVRQEQYSEGYIEFGIIWAHHGIFIPEGDIKITCSVARARNTSDGGEWETEITLNGMSGVEFLKSLGLQFSRAQLTHLTENCEKDDMGPIA